MNSANFFDPKPQRFHTFGNGLWLPCTESFRTITLTTLPSIKLLTWNIDFQTPLPAARMEAALSHLHSLILSLPPTTPSLILLQEMTISDLNIIQSNPWIRSSFYLTDLDSTNWPDYRYGTLTLIDRRLPLNSVFRVPYASDMGRDALFVDIEAESSTLRVCNTHLESLALYPPLRPAQLKLASRYLRAPTVDSGVIAGDFNAIEGFDLKLGEENALRDAYLEGGGEEAAEEGWTWGMQSPGTRFPCTRMDKILSCGRVHVKGLERFGAGLQIEGMELGEAQYATDHLGLMADVVFVEEDA